MRVTATLFKPMEIIELKTLSEAGIESLTSLMKELTNEKTVTSEMLLATVSDPSTHLFAAVEEGRIIGCASLCVSHTPTGAKGSIEDVVVGSAFRGRHIGRMLMEHIIDYARREFSPVELHLTSRPVRETANRLYQTLGFYRYETNYYKLSL